MATDKEKAEAYRLVAGDFYSHEQSVRAKAGSFTQYLREIADELDPPKPKYPDGTIAWITCGGGAARKLAQFAAGEWCDLWTPSGHPVTPGLVPDEVKPLRVLSDDEIALPRSTFAGMTWEQASRMAGGYPVGVKTYNIWQHIAYTLRAEEGVR